MYTYISFHPYIYKEREREREREREKDRVLYYLDRMFECQPFQNKFKFYLGDYVCTSTKMISREKIYNGNFECLSDDKHQDICEYMKNCTGAGKSFIIVSKNELYWVLRWETLTSYSLNYTFSWFTSPYFFLFLHLFHIHLIQSVRLRNVVKLLIHLVSFLGNDVYMSRAVTIPANKLFNGSPWLSGTWWTRQCMWQWNWGTC